MLQVRHLPLRINISPSSRITYAYPHRPKTVPLRPVRSILPPETTIETTPKPLSQSFVRTTTAPRKDTRVSGMFARLPTQGQFDTSHGNP